MSRYLPRKLPDNVQSYSEALILAASRPISHNVKPARVRDWWVQRASTDLWGHPNRKQLGLDLLELGLLHIGGSVPFFVLPNDWPLYFAAKCSDKSLVNCIRSPWAERQPDVVLACNFRCTPILVTWLRRTFTQDHPTRVSGLIPSGQPEALAAGLVESTPWPEGWSVEECACSIGVLPRAFAAELRRLAG
jgi:hypothetical protein